MIKHFNNYINEVYIYGSSYCNDIHNYFYKNSIDYDFKMMFYDYPDEKKSTIRFTNLMNANVSIEQFTKLINDKNITYTRFYFIFKDNTFSNFFILITNNNRYIISYNFKIIYTEKRNDGGFIKFLDTFFLFEDAANKGGDYVKQMQKLKSDFDLFENNNKKWK